MPKKRFTSQYSKPQSTVHPSLGSASAAASASGSRNSAAPSVNDLISNLRKTQITTPEDQRKAAANVVTPTLPPSIRSLLAIPETPPPRPRVRDRRRFDENGRRIPAGPPPPPSWRDNTRDEPVFLKPRAGRDDKTRLYPIDVGHLPGVPMPTVGSLQDICLREMARNWEFTKEYEKYNLSEMPTRLRTLLLSYIAVYGPEDGVSFEGLKDVLVPPPYEDESETQSVPDNLNDNFKRFDLSGSVGRCISFKQLSELVTKREEDESSESWEETIPMSLNPTISHITHLSLSHPPGNISWPKFLSFTQHVPTITHLSLAYWPVPNLTPNSRTAVMSSQYGREIQYGGTNLYSHSIDEDFLEASTILRRLAASLYSLQWLDLTGCTHWLGALQHLCFTEVTGLDWRSQWTSLETIVAHYGYELDEECGREDVLAFKQAVVQAACTKVLIQELRKVGRRKAWVDMQTDDVTKWDKLLTSGSKLPDQAEVNRRSDDVGTRARFFGATQSWRSVNEDWVQSP